MLHVKTTEVAVEVKWADVVQARVTVLQQRHAERNVHQEVGLTRSLYYHAQLYSIIHTKLAPCRVFRFPYRYFYLFYHLFHYNFQKCN